MQSIKDFIRDENCYVCYKASDHMWLKCIGPFKTFLEADNYFSMHLDRTTTTFSALVNVTKFYPSFIRKLEIWWKLSPKITFNRPSNVSDS